MSTSIEHLETESGRRLQESLDRAAKGQKDPEASRKALARLEQSREEMREKIGTVNVAVDLIRSARDQ